jgi:hypothetical protein
MYKNQSGPVLKAIAAEPDATFSPRIGRLAGSNDKSEILVEFDGALPRPAKLLAGIKGSELIGEQQRGREVLLVFEKGDPLQPIIIGLMENPIEEMVSFDVSAGKAKEVKDILIDGRRIIIKAEEEILLECGRGSVLVRKDGKITIKGTDLLSRSSGPHRIRGASVKIN